MSTLASTVYPERSQGASLSSGHEDITRRKSPAMDPERSQGASPKQWRDPEIHETAAILAQACVDLLFQLAPESILRFLQFSPRDVSPPLTMDDSDDEIVAVLGAFRDSDDEIDAVLGAAITREKWTQRGSLLTAYMRACKEAKAAGRAGRSVRPHVLEIIGRHNKDFAKTKSDIVDVTERKPPKRGKGGMEAVGSFCATKSMLGP